MSEILDRKNCIVGNAEHDAILVNMLPKFPQRGDSTYAQLATLLAISERIGCYDASTEIRRIMRA